MDLRSSIENALDFTRRLDAALEVGDLNICQDLIDLRADAMLVFEAAHRDAAPDDRDFQGHALRLLQEADSALQEKFRQGLESSAGELRKSLMNASATPRHAYNTTAGPSCLDRKA